MKKYRIAIEETLRKVVEIEAETPGLAVCRAEDEYNEEKHVLSADNFAGADIALSTDDSTVMETLEDVDFIGYVQRRFEECRESISVEDKVRLAFGSFDNALYEFGEYRKEAARNRPQVYLLYRSDAWHNRSSMELIAPFSSLENMMEYLRRKKKEFRLTESDLEEFKNNRQTKGRDENYLYESDYLDVLPEQEPELPPKDDAFYDKALPKSHLPEGVIFGSLKEVARQHPELVKKYYGKLADTSKDGVTAFNTTFAQDGVIFYVPKNVVVEKPIQLVNILRADVNFMVNRRVLIILEDGAQARLLICDHAMDNVNFLATQVIEVFAGENTVFDLYELEETHTSTVRISNLYVKQEANSNVLLNGMTLHNGTTRNTTEVLLAGEGAEINLCGMAIADKNQHIDNNTSIDHAVPNCTSNELFKYVLDDQSIGAFAGLVLVRPDAQHTNSQQTNRNLCATRDARMYTQPQLEIYADDVKCSHGATVGQLDENALFYMRSRGINEKEARLLLMFAFVNEVIDTIRLDALKDRLHLLVEKRFRGELNRCQGCAICK